jgi:hypothetical protein
MENVLLILVVSISLCSAILTTLKPCTGKCPSAKNFIPCSATKNIQNCIDCNLPEEIDALIKKNCVNDICYCYNYITGYDYSVRGFNKLHFDAAKAYIQSRCDGKYEFIDNNGICRTCNSMSMDEIVLYKTKCLDIIIECPLGEYYNINRCLPCRNVCADPNSKACPAECKRTIRNK